MQAGHRLSVERFRYLRNLLYCGYSVAFITLWATDPGVEIDPIDERIRELCERATRAEGSEVESLLLELRAALREHAQFVLYMSKRALSRSPQNTSSSKAAD